MGRTQLAWVPWAKKVLAGVQHATALSLGHLSCSLCMYRSLQSPSLKRPASQLVCCILPQSLLLHCRLRIQAQQQKQKLTAKSQKKFGKRLYGSAGGTATSGLSSSLAFTPVQVSHNQSCCLCLLMVQTQHKAALFLSTSRRCTTCSRQIVLCVLLPCCHLQLHTIC